MTSNLHRIRSQQPDLLWGHLFSYQLLELVLLTNLQNHDASYTISVCNATKLFRDANSRNVPGSEIATTWTANLRLEFNNLFHESNSPLKRTAQEIVVVSSQWKQWLHSIVTELWTENWKQQVPSLDLLVIEKMKMRLYIMARFVTNRFPTKIVCSCLINKYKQQTIIHDALLWHLVFYNLLCFSHGSGVLTRFRAGSVWKPTKHVWSEIFEHWTKFIGDDSESRHLEVAIEPQDLHFHVGVQVCHGVWQWRSRNIHSTRQAQDGDVMPFLKPSSPVRVYKTALRSQPPDLENRNPHRHASVVWYHSNIFSTSVAHNSFISASINVTLPIKRLSSLFLKI